MQPSVKYKDILRLPHHTSKSRSRMTLHDRAAQFSPFAALTGYEEAVEETARLTDSRLQPDDDMTADINAGLLLIKEHLAELPEITVTYFVPDERKSGGAYLSLVGKARIIDEYERSLVFVNGKRVPIDDIYSIEGELLGRRSDIN